MTPTLSPVSAPRPAHPRPAVRATGVDPERALEWLRAGNDRFVNGLRLNRDLLGQVQETAGGQHPWAAVLSCIDSRVPVETVFDLGIGDVFSLRVAGNVATPGMLGSLEYACGAAGARLAVVLGHTGCGAVKSTVAGVELGHVTGLLDEIRPCVACTAYDGDRSADDDGFLRAVATENVRQTVAALTERSELLRNLVAAGTVKVVGAVYDIASGEVTFLDA